MFASHCVRLTTTSNVLAGWIILLPTVGTFTGVVVVVLVANMNMVVILVDIWITNDHKPHHNVVQNQSFDGCNETWLNSNYIKEAKTQKIDKSYYSALK